MSRGLLAIWRANFTPLRERPIRIYLSGQAVSMVGTFLQSTALGLTVYRLSGGVASSLGLLSICLALPVLLLSPFSGVLADRFARRRLLLGCHAVQMSVALALALLSHSGALALWQIYGLALLLGCTQSVYFPAQQALLFDLAGRGEIRKLIAINSMVLNIARTSGPALAAWMIARWGVAMAFLQNGLSFLAVMGSLLALSSLRSAAHEAGPETLGAAQALRRVAGDVRLRNLFLTVAILQMFGLAMLQLVPALTGGDARATGLILASAGAGSLCYAFLLSPFVTRLSRIAPLLSLSLVWMGGWLLAMAQSGALPVRMLAMFMAGLATSLAMVGSTGTMQFVVPAGMRGRLMGLFNVVGMGLQPFAVMAVSALADRIGATSAVSLAGIAAMLLPLLMLTDRRWSLWELEPATAAPATAALSNT